MIPVATDIALPEKPRQEIVVHLKRVVADEFLLFTKLFKYHWNVRGPFFGPLHALFETQYRQAFDNTDRFAERIRALGFLAPGTLTEFADLSQIKEEPGKNPADTQMIADLLHDHEAIIKHLRKGIAKMQELGDEGTANMFAELIVQHEKSAWMLRAHLDTVTESKKEKEDVKAEPKAASKKANKINRRK